MSDEKIIDHTEKAIKAVLNKERKWYERLKEFLFEILIIIVAVSLTLWFHNLNDRGHDRKLEKNFLIGIREDLKKDTSFLLGSCVRDFQPTMNYYDSVFVQIMEHRVDKEYINGNQNYLTNTAYFLYNDARFESFRSSGNLKLIENKKILNDITYLYTIELPVARDNDKELFDGRRHSYDENIGSKLKYHKVGTGGYNYTQNVASLIDESTFQYHLAKYISLFKERKRMKLRCVQRVTGVIKEINKELEDRFDYIPSKSGKD